MSSFVGARDELVTHMHPLLSSAFPDMKIFYENTVQVDLDSVGSMFVTVAVSFNDAERLDIDLAPASMAWGSVVFRVFSKIGNGTREALAVLDGITSIMKYRHLASVVTDCPFPGRKVSKDGWMSFDLEVPFHFMG